MPTKMNKPVSLLNKPKPTLRENIARVAMSAAELAKTRNSMLSSSNRILLYGNAKSGKTALAATAVASPAIKQCYWFDLEQGIDTIFNPELGIEESTLAKITPISVRDTLANPVSPKTIATVLTARGEFSICQAHGSTTCNCDSAIKINPSTWGSDTLVVIDSLSQLSDMALIIGERIASKDPKHNAYSKYAEQGRMLMELLTNLQSAPFHTLAITHATISEDPVAKTEVTLPLCGTRAFALKVGKYFSHVLYLSLEVKKFKVGSKPTYKINTLTGTRDGLAIEDSKEAATLKGVIK